MIVRRMSVVSAEHLGIAEEIYACCRGGHVKNTHQSHDHGHLAKNIFRRDKILRCKFEILNVTEGLRQGSTERLALIYDYACFRYS